MNDVMMENRIKETTENYHLTAREKEILFYWVKDFDHRQIALLLGISRNTVKVHIAKINLKLQVNSKASLILKVLNV
ncbi:helix-turn-helix transcriptional regulator [Paenibacillus sp. S3N08]|uniref:Helix-turn-helix transcriptional regulator n=1 Tax=Paenibacillus agricola TaxID=2716264 RepID=A0ABX0J392_9BACL|nr:helix-turn-helix transcriptional regulator [Paenibacillus agricola]